MQTCCIKERTAGIRVVLLKCMWHRYCEMVSSDSTARSSSLHQCNLFNCLSVTTWCVAANVKRQNSPRRLFPGVTYTFGNKSSYDHSRITLSFYITKKLWMSLSMRASVSRYTCGRWLWCDIVVPEHWRNTQYLVTAMFHGLFFAPAGHWWPETWRLGHTLPTALHCCHTECTWCQLHAWRTRNSSEQCTPYA